MPVFKKDAQFYCNLTKPFLVELDKEIARHTAENRGLETSKGSAAQETVGDA